MRLKTPVSHRLLAAGLALLAALCLPGQAAAGERRHGLSVFGELKYPPDFTHFDYVNPDAPKGGRLSMIGTAGLITFNSLNGFILKGDAAQGLSFLFDSLMAASGDEPNSMYAMVAHSVELADDRTEATFYLRPEAKFSDGSPLTAEDVVFSLEILKEKGHPRIALPLADVERAEALDAHTVRYRFKGAQVRDLPIIVASLPIFSKAWYATRDFGATTMEAPLGSGPYAVADLSQGRYILYKRRDDYWAKDLPVNKGRFNFDELRYEYFRDRTAEFEGLKAGAYDLREEFTSKTWATQYKIPQVASGRLKTLTLPDERPSGAQGFFINVRREKFADPRVRKALDYAFDFEWTNRNQFYKLYKRTHSFFENSDMKATGRPSEAELKLLEPFRDKLPSEVFGTPYSPPVSNGSGQDRKLLRRASKLLQQAGWSVKDGKRVNAKGDVLDIEFLMFSPTFERIIAPFVKNLKVLGIDARIRLVDPSQFQSRMKSFDFDIITQRYVLRMTPGVEIRSYWGSKAAGEQGSFNLSGITDPVVDALLEKVIAAQSRDELVTAARALDRVLRAGHYWVPHWYKSAHNLAFWDKFSRPAIKPAFSRGVIDTWWYDAEKAAKLAAN
ncbi:MAG: extracellular solute-binding protein [Alphaproteobacteria bacterium]|nr:extracellular solute-binding protein [Alphaproteobacteria bacterium]